MIFILYNLYDITVYFLLIDLILLLLKFSFNFNFVFVAIGNFSLLLVILGVSTVLKISPTVDLITT